MTERTPSHSQPDDISPDWSVLTGPRVWVVFGAITVPFAVGVTDTRLMTPLAAPGYALMSAMTIVGSYLTPQYTFWLYWIPFCVCSYVISVVCAAISRN